MFTAGHILWTLTQCCLSSCLTVKNKNNNLTIIEIKHPRGTLTCRYDMNVAIIKSKRMIMVDRDDSQKGRGLNWDIKSASLSLALTRHDGPSKFLIQRTVLSRLRGTGLCRLRTLNVWIYRKRIFFTAVTQ